MDHPRSLICSFKRLSLGYGRNQTHRLYLYRIHVYLFEKQTVPGAAFESPYMLTP